MSCVTWLGRIVSRVFVTGFHTSSSTSTLSCTSTIPNCTAILAATSPYFRRNFYTNSSGSSLLSEFTSEDSISRETQNEIIRMTSASAAVTSPKERQICRTLHSKWEDFHLGPGFVSVVSGLPKDFSGATFRRGQFGDDAWFIARNNHADVIGVADGVGGWRNHGLDPGEFSFTLMQACERLVESGLFVPSKPGSLLATSYSHLRRQKEVKGSSTACVVVLSRKDSVLYCANLGDSGFIVLRNGEIVHRSKEQTHAFNTPFQLACPPPGEVGLCDSPDSADISQTPVEDGDVILVATDGVFDNLPESMLVDELIKIEGEKDPVLLQSAANAIVLMARTIAFDSKYMSPFARHAQQNGINAVGGKPDDITVLLATVTCKQ